MMETVAFRLLLVPAVAVAAIVLGLAYQGIERVLAARMQARVGPPLTQPFRDVRKLMMKESVVPRNAVRWLFNLMPVAALAASISVLLYVPLGPFAPVLEGSGDLVVVICIMMLPSLALVLGGFASASPYATVGAQREMVRMISYELPLAVVAVSVAWLLSLSSPGAAAFSMSGIAASPAWGSVGVLGAAGVMLMMAVLLFVMPGETGRIPFDAPEAEAEIAGGVLVEYSGTNLALFCLADAVKTFAFASVIIALFVPWGISGAAGLSGIPATAADSLFFLFKAFAVIFAGSTFIRVAVARFRINQIVKAYWGYATLVSVIGLVLIYADAVIGGLV